MSAEGASQQRQIIHTILTQANRCAVRAVARCEQGLLPVITTVDSGSRVFWHCSELGKPYLARGDSQDKTSARVGWSVLWLSPRNLCSPFPQARYTTVVRFWVPTMPWRKKKKCWSADASGRLDLSLTPQYGSEQDLGSPEALIPRDEESIEEDRPFPSEVFVTGGYLRAQPIRRGLAQPAKRAGESPVEVRLALLARNFEDSMHDSPGSRACCFSSVLCVRTAQSTGALPGTMVPVGPYASRRFPLAVRFSVLVWELGQSRQLLFWTHRQYLRLRSGYLESASGRGRRLIHPLTGEQPASDFLCDRQNARRHYTNLTLSLECALPPRAHVSVFLGPRQSFPS